MAMNKRDVGEINEKVARNYLESTGYVIVEYNYRIRTGEIDIIAKDGDYLVFVEVKYRSSLNLGSPYEAVDAKKQHKIRQVAAFYIMEKHLEDVPVRFDVIGIMGTKISLCKDAF